ncbi:hypothetical protein GCM10025759_14330 [Lysobacter panacisoli]|uniref:Uncharacterized protein n=1 Tax=Lysobacter panacisoli TaxID=1255263 RepID=A0ABP9LBI8_9GAMM
MIDRLCRFPRSRRVRVRGRVLRVRRMILRMGATCHGHAQRERGEVDAAQVHARSSTRTSRIIPASMW